MTTVSDFAVEYFSSINTIAKKIIRDQETLKEEYGSAWNDLTLEKQEELIDACHTPSHILEKYTGTDETDHTTALSFPKLKILCGQKIVIDYDSDMWTWRDEHSGPFSWKTRSQKELPLFNEETKPIKPPRSRKPDPVTLDLKQDKPEMEDPDKPQRSIWDSPFLVAEKSRSPVILQRATYHPSSEETPKGERCIVKDVTADEKFNVVNETSKVSYVTSSKPKADPCHRRSSSISPPTSPRKALSQIMQFGSERIKSPDKKIKSFFKGSPKKSKSEAQRSLLEEKKISKTVIEKEEDNSAMTPDESDIDAKIFLPSSFSEVSSPQNIKIVDNMSSPSQENDLEWSITLDSNTTKEDSILPKTGFDFLDNW